MTIWWRKIEGVMRFQTSNYLHDSQAGQESCGWQIEVQIESNLLYWPLYSSVDHFPIVKFKKMHYFTCHLL